ncbi:hypothetical protein MMC31_007611 [Peltigera leucophlebia]|nr:hypothetical protein [Peltigera leucophlebia]
MAEGISQIPAFGWVLYYYLGPALLQTITIHPETRTSTSPDDRPIPVQVDQSFKTGFTMPGLPTPIQRYILARQDQITGQAGLLL